MQRVYNKWLILALLATSFFMVVLDISVVNVALPSLAKDLHFAPNDLQWVITAYSITFGGFLLLGGRTSDIFGRRRLFMAAVLLFALSSLTCGLSQSSVMLVIARAVQGLTAAFMTPTALSIVLTEFKEGKERNLALGVWAAVASSGAAVGVILGGVLTQYLGWRWNFFVNVPVGLVVAILAYFMIPYHRSEETRHVRFRNLDHVGSSTATLGLMALVYGLSRAPVDGWGSKTVWIALIVSALSLLGFVFNESRVKDPLLPLRFFRIRNITGGDATALVVAASLFSMFFFMTLYLQTVLGYSPVKAGVAFLVTPITIAIFSGITSQLVGRIGYKPTMVIGPIILAFGLYILSNIRVHGTYMHDVMPGLVVCGVGLGFTFVSLTLAATSGVEAQFSGLVSGMLNTAQQVGGAIGLALLSEISSSAFKTSLATGDSFAAARVHGFHDALRVGLFLALGAAILALIIVKNKRIKPDEAMVGSMEQAEPAPA